MSSLDDTQYCLRCEADAGGQQSRDGIPEPHTCGLERVADTRLGMQPQADPMRAAQLKPLPPEVEPPGSLTWPDQIRQCLLALHGKCSECLDDCAPGLDLVDGWGMMCERCETTVGFENIGLVIRAHLQAQAQEIAALEQERDERRGISNALAVVEIQTRARLDALRWVQAQAGVVPYPLSGILEREIARLESLLAEPKEQPDA